MVLSLPRSCGNVRVNNCVIVGIVSCLVKSRRCWSCSFLGSLVLISVG